MMERGAVQANVHPSTRPEGEFYPSYEYRLRRKLIEVNLKKAVKFFLNGQAVQRRYFLKSLGMMPRRERKRWAKDRPLLVHACSMGEVLAAQL